MSATKHSNRNEYLTPELQAFVQERMAVESRDHARVIKAMEAAGLPAIQIGPTEGRILEFLVRSCGAKRAVEIGTLGGYSALWIAGALPPSGKLFTFEFEEKHAAVAQKCFTDAGLAKKITLIVGDAKETLKKIEPLGPFDFVFIDADKVGYAAYLAWAARNLRSGGIVAVDNAYLFGKLHLKPSEAGEEAPRVRAMHEMLRLLTDESEFASCAMIPTGEGLAVGIKR